MRLVRLLPERWRKFLREAVTFGVVGGLNTVINFAVFNALILTVFTDGQLKANVAASIVATTTSYFMNRHWTYRDRPRSQLRREYVLFFAFNAAGLVIELAVLGAVKYGFGLTSVVAINAAKAAGVALGTIFRFWSYRTFVFKPAPRSATPATEPARPATVGQPAPQPRGHRPHAVGSAETPTTRPEPIGPTLDEELAAELAAAERTAAS